MAAADFDIEKNFERLVKILERAKRGSTVHEAQSAARMTANFLREHPLPIRWFVPLGTPCRVVPSQYMGDLREAAALIREIKLHKDRWVRESDRVKGDGSDKSEDRMALEAGFLYFQQYGFAIFVPVSYVTVHL